MSNYKPFQRLTAKDLSTILVISETTAKRYLKDIKLHFAVVVVTYQHFLTYFNLS